MYEVVIISGLIVVGQLVEFSVMVFIIGIFIVELDIICVWLDVVSLVEVVIDVII